MSRTRQVQILDYLKDYQRRHLVTPTYREIAEAVGVASTGTIHYHIERLVAAGHIARPRIGHTTPLQIDSIGDDASAEALSVPAELALWRDTAARVVAERDQMRGEMQALRHSEGLALAHMDELREQNAALTQRIQELEEANRRLQVIATVRTLRTSNQPTG